jgi:hypothetical protein
MAKCGMALDIFFKVGWPSDFEAAATAIAVFTP